MTEELVKEFAEYSEDDLANIFGHDEFQQFFFNDSSIQDVNVSQVNLTEQMCDESFKSATIFTMQNFINREENSFSSDIMSHDLMTNTPELDYESALQGLVNFEKLPDLPFSETCVFAEKSKKESYTSSYEIETSPSIEPQLENLDVAQMTSCSLSQVIEKTSGKPLDEILQMGTKPFNQLLKKLSAMEREELKRKRRQLKNRSYAKTCRNKKGDQHQELKMEVSFI